MTKIVYNICYGGFGLSDAAWERYAELKGIALYRHKGNDYCWWTHPTKKTMEYYFNIDIPRDDPFLVQVVEEFGEKANGRCARLRIEELPAGTLYRIDEYDGYEKIIIGYDDWRVA